MKNIETSVQFDEIIKEGVTLVDFHATWCGPCRMLAPFIEEIDEEFSNSITVAKLDVDECSDVAARFGINAIPALLIFKNGELAKTNIGFISKEDIVGLINEVVSE